MLPLAGALEKELERNRHSPGVDFHTQPSDPSFEGLIHNQEIIRSDNVRIQCKLKGEFCEKLTLRAELMPFG